MRNIGLTPEFRVIALKILGKLLALSIVGLLGAIVAGTVQEFGATHALSAFGIGAFFCMLFIALDNLFSSSISKLQWAALFINVLLLSYTFLLLPTQEALEVLNSSRVNQNLWEQIKEWWVNT